MDTPETPVKGRTYSVNALVIQLLSGLLVGAVIAGLLGPRLIAWWAAPSYMSNGFTAEVNTAIEWAMSRLLLSMAIAGGIGALLVPTAAYLLFYRRKKVTPAA